jgi:hypothetical protein
MDTRSSSSLDDWATGSAFSFFAVFGFRFEIHFDNCVSDLLSHVKQLGPYFLSRFLRCFSGPGIISQNVMLSGANLPHGNAPRLIKSESTSAEVWRGKTVLQLQFGQSCWGTVFRFWITFSVKGGGITFIIWDSFGIVGVKSTTLNFFGELSTAEFLNEYAENNIPNSDLFIHAYRSLCVYVMAR